MTQETNLPAIVNPEDAEFGLRLKERLSIVDANMLKIYIDAGKHQLSPEVAANFYSLFLSGSSFGEIHRLNKAFPYEAIVWAAVKFDWWSKRDEYSLELQSQTAHKVMTAQLETAGLMADLLTAANKKHGDKIKKYLQSGNEQDLGDSLSIESLQNLMRIAESLQKVTGQANTVKIKNETINTQNVNLNLTSHGSSMDAATAEAVLKVVSDAKKKATST